MNPIYESNALTVYDYKYDLLKKSPINQIASIVIDKSRFSYQTEKLNFFKRNLPNWWEKMLTEIGDRYSNPIKEENIFFNAILINKSLTPKEIDIPEELTGEKKTSKEENAYKEKAFDSLFVISIAEQFRRRTNGTSVLIQSPVYDLLLFIY